MTAEKKKSFSYYMRAMHRDVGFFVVGLTIIYCLSGIVLIHRDTDFLKRETKIEKTLSTNLDAEGLGTALRMKDFKLTEEKENLILFNRGTYDKTTGVVTYTDKVLPSVLNKWVGLHKSVSKSSSYFPTMLYGVLLLFLAISSLWMYKPRTKHFRRGIVLVVIGIIASIIILI